METLNERKDKEAIITKLKEIDQDDEFISTYLNEDGKEDEPVLKAEC